MNKKDRHIATLAIHAGQEPEPITGAVMTPVFQTSTYAQPHPAEWPWEYSRTHNPTRTALQDCVAALEKGAFGVAFSSGMAAIDAVIRSLLKPGDKVLCGDDVYGGTYRLFTKSWAPFGIEFEFVDTSKGVELSSDIKMVWLETPTNPLLKTSDIAEIARKAHEIGAILVVDNTFATPIFQQPLVLGADVVVHSMTKYLNGHSDVIAGIVVTNDSSIHEQLCFIQNSAGAVMGPWDCFLVLRGLKTLHVRMERHQKNAKELVSWLKEHKQVRRVLYPGFGGMISFVLDADLDAATRFVKATEVFTLAESLGGVESLIELPATMTHASVPKEIRTSLGIDDGLIRLSVGIEHIEDLKDDLQSAFAQALSSVS